MACGEQMDGPFGVRATHGGTVLTQRTVLIAVHTVTAGIRLADIWPLLEGDRRIQLVFTRPPGALVARGTDEFLAGLDGVVVSWDEATQVPFDLAIAASYGHLERLQAPVVTMSHGIGFSKLAIRYEGSGPEAPLEVAGLERAGLIYRGRVIPSSVLVPTRQDLQRLCREFPEAASVATVTGDLCYDRLAASLPLRDAHRRALGTGDRKLVAVSSTWGSGSLLQRCPDLIPKLADELPPEEYVLAAIVHPNTWCWHGRRQLRAWYRDAIYRGLVLVPPEEGWRAVLAACDWVVGDHGSVSCYAAACGIPVLLGTFAEEDLDPDSPVHDVAKIAPRLRASQPVRPLLAEAAVAWSAESAASIRGRVTDVPGQSAQLIRRVLYKLLSLLEPASVAGSHPLKAPAVNSGMKGGRR